MSAIEQEILKITKFKPSRKVKRNRQDFLAGLARSCNDLSDDDFEEFSDTAAEWVNEALKSIKGKDEIDDFADSDDDDDNGDDDNGDDDDGDDDDGDDNGDDDDDDGEGGDISDGEKEEKPRRRRGRPSKSKGTTKSKKEKKASAGTDRYGIRIGSKNADAIDMFEKGASMAVVREKTGSNKYNLLNRLRLDGHDVETLEGVIRLTHKEEATGDSRPKKKDKKSKDDKTKSSGKSDKKGEEKSSGKKKEKATKSKDEGSSKKRKRK